MKKALPFFGLLTLLGFNSFGQTITYSEHIAPIVYSHCTSCHRVGEIGPFPLTNYQEVSSWGNMIKYVTSIGYMPPWKPEKEYQHYRYENFLSPQEIQQIADWVDQGTPQGNPSLEPPLPNFPTGSQVGNPDLVVSFAQSYLHVGNNVDEYRYFNIPTGLTEDKDLVALEIRPGNKQIVHHTLVWQDTTGQSAADDAASPGYGYTNPSTSTLATINNQLPGYVPGQKPVKYTNGMGMKLYAGADLKLQMHYAPYASDEYDSTSINLFFADQPIQRYVKSYVMLPLPSILTNGPFIIQANTVKEFHGKYTTPVDITLVGIAPHMHKLGQHWKVYGVKPSGDTIPLININDWDFNWQGSYAFKTLIPMPAGSTLHAYAEYDNTTNNPNNPNHPPQNISWGEGTSDEMYYLPVLYMDYQPGDENITFNDDPTSADNANLRIVQNKLYPVFPNPSNNQVKIGFTLQTGGKVNLKVIDQQGKLVKELLSNQFCLPGFFTQTLEVSELSQGVYSIVLEIGEQQQTEKLVVE